MDNKGVYNLRICQKLQKALHKADHKRQYSEIVDETKPVRSRGVFVGRAGAGNWINTVGTVRIDTSKERDFADDSRILFGIDHLMREATRN